ncbi:uncharacterized protein LOC131479000 [Ochotona princeps]|uniref:uncharacterized protein LOC131479000 n=1 Tax=Ochotona princeps TaxID=9978 RepID=UPI0027145C3D|nr:uncharacterized protein LOC131479000 [Ochotona princeps]
MRRIPVLVSVAQVERSFRHQREPLAGKKSTPYTRRQSRLQSGNSWPQEARSSSSNMDSSSENVSVSSALRKVLESRVGAAAPASGMSAAEQLFLEEGAECGVREDGRACCDVLPSDVMTHVLPQCHASAAVRSSENAVLCGVQLQVGKPSALAPGEGIVFLGIDCAAAVGPRVGGGGAAGARGPSDFAEGTGGSQRMQSLLVDLMLGPAAIDKSKLCILPGKLCFHVYIDCMVLMAGGSLLDALSLSIVAALRTLILPNVFVETDEEDEDEKEGDEGEGDNAILNVACDERPHDVSVRLQCYIYSYIRQIHRNLKGEVNTSILPYTHGGHNNRVPADVRGLIRLETAGTPFPASNIPLIVTVGQIGRHYVWDMRASEEAACSSRLAVAVTSQGLKSVGLQTLGNSLVDPATFSSLMVSSQRVCGELFNRLEERLRIQRRQQRQQQLHAFMEMMQEL